MQVWYLIGTLAVGGAERTLVDLANELDNDRFEVTIWTLSEPGPLADEVADHVRLRSLDARNKADVVAVARFVRALRRERPAILQSFLFFDNVVARLAGLASPETVVVSGVREVPDDRPLWRELLTRSTRPLAGHVVSNSEAGAEYVIRRGASPESVHVIRNGRPLESYADVTVPDGYRDDLGLQPGPVVGTVGRLVERKGQYDLLDAWPRVRETEPDAQLVLVGDGPEREGLAERAATHGVRDSVHLLGRRDDVPRLLALFDVFVFPSHYEGLPGALLEAMAAGLPIVCTPVDGNAELVTHGDHGIHVPVRDPPALADAVTALLADRDRAARLGARASDRAQTSFTLDRMVTEFADLYDSVAPADASVSR